MVDNQFSTPSVGLLTGERRAEDIAQLVAQGLDRFLLLRVLRQQFVRIVADGFRLVRVF